MTDEEILDAIKGRRYAAAKREISSKLIRFPRKIHYNALNAFYLLSTGSTKQALEECDKVTSKIPSDPATLEILHDIYSRTGRRNEACLLYEAAVKRHPTADIASAWHGKSMQLLDAQMMQKSATALKYASPMNRVHQLESVFADILWSEECLSEKESTQLLESALGVMQNLEPLQSNQEAFLYATLLMKFQDYHKIVEVVEPVKSKELELILLLLEALDKGEEWEKLFNFSYDLLFEKSFNDYATWKYMIRAGNHLKKSYEDLQRLVSFDSRNSYVANIEISRVFAVGIEEAIDVYFDKFKSKPCCGTDLCAFELPVTFIEKVGATKCNLLQKTQLSKDEKAICVNIERILSNSCEEMVDWGAYEKFDGPELADLYLASMLQSASEDLSTSRVIEHITKLEKFADADPENFNIKLWLLNLYSTICGSSMSLRTYEDLKIKMIQHDTLAYKLNLEPSAKNLNQLIQIYRFHLTGEREIAAYFGIALKKGLFTKLRDLFRFGNRLKTSLSRHLVVLQISKMCRMLNSDYLGHFQGLVQDSKSEVLSNNFKVSDNRDFQVDYNLGFKVDQKIFFRRERKMNKEYVQLQYLKENIIAEKQQVEIERLIKVFDKWLGTRSFADTLSPSENHFCKLILAIFKLTKLAPNKNHESQINYLTKNLDFKKIEKDFLSKTSALSSSANRILVDTLDVSKLISTLSSDDKLTALGRAFQAGLVRYIVTGPEMTQFKQIRKNLSADFSSMPHFEEQLDHLEDGIQASKFKMR